MLGITGKNGFPAPSGAVRGDFSVELVFGATESPALNFSAVSLSITHRGSWRVGPPHLHPRPAGAPQRVTEAAALAPAPIPLSTIYGIITTGSASKPL